MDNKKEVALKVENIILESVRARLKLFSVLTQSDDLIIIPTFLPDLICAPTKEILISSCGFNCLIWVAHGSSNPDVTALNIMMVVDCGNREDVFIGVACGVRALNNDSHWDIKSCSSTVPST